MRVVTIDSKKCIGCGNCEYACSFNKTNDFEKDASRITVTVHIEERLCIPLTCFHCTEAPCMEICPTSAINRNQETEAVEIEAKRCIGCKMCMIACPFGSIRFNTKERVSKKCDMCSGDPNCVKYCISGALQYEKLEDAYQFKKKQFENKLKSILQLEREISGRSLHDYTKQ